MRFQMVELLHGGMGMAPWACQITFVPSFLISDVRCFKPALPFPHAPTQSQITNRGPSYCVCLTDFGIGSWGCRLGERQGKARQGMAGIDKARARVREKGEEEEAGEASNVEGADQGRKIKGHGTWSWSHIISISIIITIHSQSAHNVDISRPYLSLLASCFEVVLV